MNYRLFLIALFLIFTSAITSCSKEENEEDNEIVNDLGSFTDSRDGNTYKWVKIGDQIWMAENLAYLPMVNLPDEKSETQPRYYVYGHNSTSTTEARESGNYKTYGVLYNHKAALEAVPDGWRLPTYDDLIELCSYMNEELGPYNRSDMDPKDPDSSLRWDHIGAHLKAKNGWHNGFNGTDNYGFNALAAGIIKWEGTDFSGLDAYMNLTELGQWWTNTVDAEGDLVYKSYTIWSGDTYVMDVFIVGSTVIKRGISVRCIKQ